MKKLLSLMLVFILLLSTLSACNSDKKADVDNDKVQENTQNNTQKADEKDTEDSKTKDNQTDEKFKVTWANWVDMAYKDNSWIEKELESIFNDIDFDFWAFERSTFADQLNTRIAGGDVPDIIYRVGRVDTVQYVDQDILAEVPIKFIKENAPNIVNSIQEHGNDTWLVTYINGKNYGIPYVQPTQSYPFCDAWRKDWLENVGIDKVPETLDEMEEAFKRFTFNDPDKNGKDDTYAVTERGKDSFNLIFKAVFGAYGVASNMWNIQEDGSLKYFAVDPRCKDALATINKWYEAGYIDPEFITSDWSIVKEKWYNDKVGYVPSTWYRNIPTGEIYDGLMSISPDAKICQAPAVKGPNGDYGYMGWSRFTSALGFGKHLEEDTEKLAAIIQMLDKVVSDEEIYGMIKYGQKGEHWQRNAETNGPEYIGKYVEQEQRAPLGTAFFNSVYGTLDIQAAYEASNAAEESKYARDRSISDGVTWSGAAGDLIPPKYNEDTNADLTNIQQSWFISFILGDEPLSKWDEYVDEWMNAGGDYWTEGANETYNNLSSNIEEINNELK